MSKQVSGDGAAVRGKSVVKGIGWNFVAIIGEQISSLIAFVLIARVLGPTDFGIVLLSVALIDILITFVRGGVSEALIRVPQLTPTMLATGFWLNMGMAVTLAAVLYGFAPTFGSLIQVPETVTLLRTMTIVFPIAAAGAIAEALLTRNLAFASIARRQILGSFAGAVIAILLAFSGYGVWAMIFQRIAIFSVGAALSIWAARLRPQFRFSGKDAKQIAGFGSGVAFINIMYRLQPRAIELVIGFLANPAMVALYRAAYRLVDLVNQVPMQPLMRVIFPTLTRLTGDMPQFRIVLLNLMGGLQLLLLPIFACIGYFSRDIFHLLFGEKWDAAVPAFVLLLTASAIAIPLTFLGPATSARGAVRASLVFVMIDVGINLALMIAAASFGIEAIAASRIVGVLVLLPIAYFLLAKPAGITVSGVALAVRTSALIAAAMIISLMSIEALLGEFSLSLNLFVGIAICGLLYALFVSTIAAAQVERLLQTMDTPLSRKLMKLKSKWSFRQQKRGEPRSDLFTDQRPIAEDGT